MADWRISRLEGKHVMQAKYAKDETDPSYDNLQTTVCKSKTTSRLDDIRLLLKRPVVKRTALITTITVLSVIIVVPTVLEVTRHERIAGNWGNWTSFSECSHSCGGGTQYRVRSCDNPSPSVGGIWCEGNDTDIQSCNNETCPVHGGWGNWKAFTECSHSCGGGTQIRQRDCDKPSPAYGGIPCSGNQNETKACNTDTCPVHGSWGSWTDVSGCSHSCDGGTSYRQRMCNNPSPSFGGNWCLGNVTEFQACNTQGCPDYRSAFSVRLPVDGPTSGTIKFSTVITNIGGHYDTSTGQFICDYPGTYIFTINIYTHSSYGVIYCYIRRNGSNLIYVYSSNNGSNYAGSNTVILHLRHGDNVDLGGCTGAKYFYGYPTSFSGFLLKTD